MAIDLPTAREAIDPARYFRGRYILSGDAAADKTYGMRGLSSQANHGYAYRVQTIDSAIAHDDDQIYEGTTTDSTYEDIFGPAPVEWGADVVTVTMQVDYRTIVDGDFVYLRLAVHDGTAWRYSTGISRDVETFGDGSDTATLTVTTGEIGQVKIQKYGDAAEAGIEIRGYVIHETVLTSGQVP